MTTSSSGLTQDGKSEIALLVNEISRFLAHQQILDAAALDSCLIVPAVLNGDSDHDASSPTHEVVVLCGSAILQTAETVFSWASERMKRAADGGPSKDNSVVLIICGGIGHSTSFLYEAVKKHPVFHQIAPEMDGMPESRVLQAIAERFYHVRVGPSKGLRILVEDKSTNCGANAIETRRVLDSHGITSPQSIIVVQDPTMCRRTVACFEKAYEKTGSEPHILGWPTFVPEVRVRGQTELETAPSSPLSFLGYAKQTGPDADQLWDFDRFIDLILGEIPRMRDDEEGYGPRGKGFIPHVDIPPEVEIAWGKLEVFRREHASTGESRSAMPREAYCSKSV